MPPLNPNMFPELPADLAALTDEELTSLLEQFSEIAGRVKARDEETLGSRDADEILVELGSGVASIKAIKAEQTARLEAEENFNASLAALIGEADLADAEESDEAEGDDSPEAEPVEAAPEVEALEPVSASAKVRRPLPASRRHRAQVAELPEGAPLLASSTVHPFSEPGEILTSRRLAEIQTEMINKNRITYGQKVIIASATFDFPEDRMLGKDGTQNSSKIDNVIGSRSLTASGGLCAPLTPIYTIPSVEVADRPVRDALAGFRADRGGVIVPENPILSDYANAVGVVTAEDDAEGGTFALKTCMRIECPQFNSVEVDSIYQCIEVGNLTGKAYPELLTRVNTLVAANHARRAETVLLDAIKGGSVAVTDVNTTSTAGAVWKLLGYLQATVEGMQSRNRMSDNAAIRGLFPEWLIGAIQADLGRSSFTKPDAESDARALFAQCGVTATFYKDGPSDGTAQVFAAQTAGNLIAFPTAVQYAIFPEGAWMHLDSGSLDLGIVRDSTLNSTNDYQVFSETWEQAALIGVDSQWHTATLSFNGTYSAPKDFSASTSF